jgi:8-amino-7-oxononanoate synthase
MLGKYAHLAQSLSGLRDAGINPFAVAFDEILSPTSARLNGQTVMLLGTNNYLGLTFDESCIASAVAALETEGTGTTGSRIANGTYGAHVTLEKRVASFLGRRDAMVFTTGYQANLGIMAALAGRDDHLLLDADSHASIYDGSRLAEAQVTRFRHNDPDDLYRRLRYLADKPGDKLIVVEGIYSMLGDVAPLKEFAAVKRETGAYLLVDEAHSLGVLGENGRGLQELAGVEADVDFVVGTFSKSLGSIGGFCASDMEGFEVLRVASRAYMFTASMPPSIAASVSQAFDVMAARPDLRQALTRNADALYDGLSKAGFRLGPTPSPIVSVRLSKPEIAVAFWNKLLARGLYVNLALPPATPARESLLRTSVSAAHSAADIRFAVEAITAVGEELGIIGEPVAAAASAAD